MRKNLVHVETSKIERGKICRMRSALPDFYEVFIAQLTAAAYYSIASIMKVVASILHRGLILFVLHVHSKTFCGNFAMGLIYLLKYIIYITRVALINTTV